MITYQKEILSVYDDGVRIGFIARSSVIFGYVQGIEDTWVIFSTKGWLPGYATRKEAVAALKRIKEKRPCQ